MDLNAISKVLAEASALPAGNRNGMRISLPGTLAHAARSLREMALSLEDAPEHISEQWEERLQESLPDLRAFALEELSKHLGMLKAAFVGGDAATVRQFFDIYVFD